MNKKRNPKTKRVRPKGREDLGPGASLEVHSELEGLRGRLQELADFAQEAEGRLEDLEIHVNLLTRLITTLCIEKMGMRVGVLKRLIKRIEKEAVRDSQIMHLESIYNLPAPQPEKPKMAPKNQEKGDPWEEIS